MRQMLVLRSISQKTRVRECALQCKSTLPIVSIPLTTDTHLSNLKKTRMTELGAEHREFT